MTPEEFKQALAKQGINLTDKQMDQFQQYYQQLIAANKQVNLTRITEKRDVYLKHFYDSLMGAFAYAPLKTEKLRLVDIGAGAGFPSLPLKLAFPQLKITIVDSLNKRLNFLRDLISNLNLNNVDLVHARAEDFSKHGSQYRQQFDVATGRAVARMSVLAEYCLSTVKVGGVFLAYKAAAAEDELQDAEAAINKLGGHYQKTVTLELPTQPVAEQRNLILIDKVKDTPSQYPRRAGTPAKKPLH